MSITEETRLIALENIVARICGDYIRRALD
jgi:hypothetical protein